ncbi:hypothetical protein F7734_60250 [Scytonema sp. UIC 10036]|uniref:hypothetical protein n=1 Tax=Scytonema sp. UIC 10036 TaxID=2304196 RepID=UPI0012DA73A1|nr:hypothetical protein [Scytonema sp. UIC 10036]MUH01856.1 hypothetical protein [Scytonema sp. UIC 10036]
MVYTYTSSLITSRVKEHCDRARETAKLWHNLKLEENGKLSTLRFDLDDLIKAGCDRIRNYLKNNPNAESDRDLCEDIK